METIEKVMHQRFSCRAYLDKMPGRETIAQLLAAASLAPSGVNMQPWQVAVVMADTKHRLSEALVAAATAGTRPNPDYVYYPEEWFEPYKSRRRETGLTLYKALGIARDDSEARREAWNNNYRFFGAPVGLLLFLDKRLGLGSWIDMGMFMQNLMLAATDHGLATCPQASLADYPHIVRRQLGYEDNWALLGGLSLGYPDPDAPANSFRLQRESVEAFTRWYE